MAALVQTSAALVLLALAAFVSCVHARDAHTGCPLLLSMSAKLGGIPTFGSADASCCNRGGIQCDASAENITGIFLHSRGLNGPFPTDLLTSFANLRQLNVANNPGLTGSVSLTALPPHLRHLDLSNTGLAGEFSVDALAKSRLTICLFVGSRLCHNAPFQPRVRCNGFDTLPRCSQLSTSEPPLATSTSAADRPAPPTSLPPNPPNPLNPSGVPTSSDPGGSPTAQPQPPASRPGSPATSPTSPPNTEPPSSSPSPQPAFPAPPSPPPPGGNDGNSPDLGNNTGSSSSSSSSSAASTTGLQGGQSPPSLPTAPSASPGDLVDVDKDRAAPRPTLPTVTSESANSSATADTQRRLGWILGAVILVLVAVFVAFLAVGFGRRRRRAANRPSFVTMSRTGDHASFHDKDASSTGGLPSVIVPKSNPRGRPTSSLLTVNVHGKPAAPDSMASPSPLSPNPRDLKSPMAFAAISTMPLAASPALSAASASAHARNERPPLAVLPTPINTRYPRTDGVQSYQRPAMSQEAALATLDRTLSALEFYENTSPNVPPSPLETSALMPLPSPIPPTDSYERWLAASSVADSDSRMDSLSTGSLRRSILPKIRPGANGVDEAAAQAREPARLISESPLSPTTDKLLPLPLPPFSICTTPLQHAHQRNRPASNSPVLQHQDQRTPPVPAAHADSDPDASRLHASAIYCSGFDFTRLGNRTESGGLRPSTVRSSRRFNLLNHNTIRNSIHRRPNNSSQEQHAPNASNVTDESVLPGVLNGLPAMPHLQERSADPHNIHVETHDHSNDVSDSYFEFDRPATRK
ncbi:hypothetical protein BC831DRAFT_287022 [Entophlyctis helioformis]|nr:hypothetical protein BC831DRAFT_287022 [Entophlyctis helioformis]